MGSLIKTIAVIIAVAGLSLILEAKPQTPSMAQAFKESLTAESNKNYSEAAKILKNVYDEKNYEINLRLAWLYYSAKDYTKSLEYYGKAINLKPNAIEAKLGYVKPASSLEMWDKVLEKYEDILKIDANNTYANYWAGMIYYNRNKFEQAGKYFKKVVDLYPTDAESLIMLGWVRFKLKKYAQAKECFESVLLLYPTNASALEGIKLIGNAK